MTNQVEAVIARLEAWRDDAKFNAHVMGQTGRPDRQAYYNGAATAYQDALELLTNNQ